MSIWRWRPEDPDLRTALEQRQTADQALAEHNRNMKKKYGRSGVPSGSYDRWVSDRLENLAGQKLEDVLNVQAELKARHRAENDARSWERFDRWTTAIDRTIDKYQLTRWSRMTEQERWDEYAEENADRAQDQARIARVAERFGLKRAAAKAREEVRVREFMAWRAERCPNNPRNGGDGFGRAGLRNGERWTERRGDDWEYVEDYLERTASSKNPAGGPLDAFERWDQSGDGSSPDPLVSPDPHSPSLYLIDQLDGGVANNTRTTRRWDGEPETPAETRFFDLRESGYTGWIDKNGYAVACPSCDEPGCTRGLTEHGGDYLGRPSGSGITEPPDDWDPEADLDLYNYSGDEATPNASRPYFLDLINRIDKVTDNNGGPAVSQSLAGNQWSGHEAERFDKWDQSRGGSAMTAPSAPTATGDIVSIADLRDIYQRTAPAMAGVQEQQSAAAAGFRDQAAAYEAAVGGLTSEGHDSQTIAEASAAMEAMHEAARLSDEAAAAADAAQGAIEGALQGLERHRALEEAVASHAGPATRTDAYAPR